MNIMYMVLMIVTIMGTGCSAEPKTITGTVIDAETGTPIEGAVVLVEWTSAHGLGNTYTTSDKVAEVLTDKEGQFTVTGQFYSSNTDLTIYKKGYIAWSSRMIFPDWRNRTDFKWSSTRIFKMERFKSEYSYDKHISFISSAISSTIGKKPLITKAYFWEEDEAFKERKRSWHK